MSDDNDIYKCWKYLIQAYAFLSLSRAIQSWVGIHFGSKLVVFYSESSRLIVRLPSRTEMNWAWWFPFASFFTIFLSNILCLLHEQIPVSWLKRLTIRKHCCSGKKTRPPEDSDLINQEKEQKIIMVILQISMNQVSSLYCRNWHIWYIYNSRKLATQCTQTEFNKKTQNSQYKR